MSKHALTRLGCAAKRRNLCHDGLASIRCERPVWF